jgi:nucleoside-diphosphate-sugar epimerase
MSRGNQKILVTGASGFVGVNLVKCLAENGYDVLGTTRRVEGPDPLVKDYLRGLGNKVTWVIVDLTDSDKVMQIGKEHNISGIIHAAVFTAVTKEIEKGSSRKILESNLMGTVNTLELAKEVEVNRYVYVSSSGVYGRTENPNKPVFESSNAPYLRMRGFYGITKIASEKLTERYNNLFPFTTTSMRIAAPYGNMERPTRSRNIMGPIYRLLYLILIEGKEKIRVKGLEYSRDWTFVMDTAECLMNGLENADPVSQIYNVSYGVNSDIKQILTEIQDVPEIDFSWEETKNDKEADFLVSTTNWRGPLSILKAKEELGFKPKYPLRRGIRAYCDWWRRVSEKGLWPEE